MGNINLRFKENIFYIEGEINFGNVMPLVSSGMRYMSSQKMASISRMIVDFQNLIHCDSSGLALCCAWIKSAQKIGKKISFVNVPLRMQNLIKVYGIEFIQEKI